MSSFFAKILAHVSRLVSTSITYRLWRESIISFWLIWLMVRLSKNLQITIRFDVVGFYIGSLTVLVKLGGLFTAADRFEHFGLINLWNFFPCETFGANNFI